MSSTNDPLATLDKFQRALEMGLLSLQPGELHKDISVALDQPNGTFRYTYAKVEGQTVQSVAFFVYVRAIYGMGRFQVTFATAEPFRRRGLASDILAKGIEELAHGLRKQGPDSFYLDAVVPNDNEPANRVASKLISDVPMKHKDPDTAERAGLYRRLVD